MIEFFNYYIHPTSPTRAKLAVHLVAQAKSDVTTKQISDLVKALSLTEDSATQAAADLQARLSAAHHDEAKEAESLKDYLTNTLSVTEDKIEAAVEAWKQVSKYHKATNGTAEKTDSKESKENGGSGSQATAINGTAPIHIKNIRDFRAGLSLTGGPRAITDISEFLDVDAKL